MPSSNVMHEFKHGELHSGSKKGPKVASRKQAIAIMLSEQRNEAKHGGHYVSNSEGKRPTGSAPFSDAEIAAGHRVVETHDYHEMAQGGFNSPNLTGPCKDENYALDNPKACKL